jgi:hypothetical protein
MGHYAKVRDAKVIDVIVADLSFFETFKDSTPGQWIQTSYNTRGGIYYLPNSNIPAPDQSKALRKNFAGIGYSYSFDLDAFIPPQPFPSWLLNIQTCLWEAPVPYPNDGEKYYWDEATLSWVLEPSSVV